MATDKPGELLGPWERLIINERAGGIRLTVHARPRSSRSAILGVREGELDVALTALPADGAANGELLKLVARALGVRPGDVSIVTGASGRNKVLAVNGVRADEARKRLAGAQR
jgi:uncharacterized protein